MPSVFQASILSPEKKLFEGDVSSLMVPSCDGYAGILARHAPLMAVMAAGKVVARDASGKEKVFDVREKGFVQMAGNKVTVLIL
jgi:F-type H+-transporting ATPase subunit epsilon